MTKIPVSSGVTFSAVVVVSLFSVLLANPSIAETPSQQQQQPNQQQPNAQQSDAAPPEEIARENQIAGTSVVNSLDTTEINKASETTAPPAHGFVATAYSLRGRTATGRYVSKGLIAADRSVLPLGSRVRLEAGSYSGEYTVADTGAKIRGKKVDIWMPSSGEARRFGRRAIKLTVLKYGGKGKSLTNGNMLIRAKR